VTRARLTVDLPPGTWIREVSESHSDAVFRVLAALAADDAGVGLLELRAPDLDAVLAAVADHDGIERLDRLDDHGDDADGALLQFETTQPFLLQAVRNSMVPLEFPLRIVDGRTELELTATQSRLSDLTAQFEAFGLSYEVEAVHQSPPSTDLLSPAQRDLLAAAVDRGYYDTPRECTLTDLAAELGVAKSTLSERLHRIEGTVLKSFLGEEEAGTGQG
jgi:hypothetical protein